MKRYSYCMFFMVIAIISCLAFLVIDKSYSLPSDDTNIVKVHNEVDVTKFSKADGDTNRIKLNIENGNTSVGSFDDLAAGESFYNVVNDGSTDKEKKELIEDYLLEDGRYAVKETSNPDLIEVLPIYSNKRIRVNSSKKHINTYSAKSGVFYDDYYVLSYDSELDTKYAYENLIKDYGKNNVLVDLPLDSKAIKGWGTSFMSFNKKLLNINPNNNVIVAVLDSGIDSTHEIFNGVRVLDGLNVLNSLSYPIDDYGHGTSVSGIISESVKGANVSILPIKVLNQNGTGSLVNILNSLDYAERNNARIANLSLAINFSDYYSSDAVLNTMMVYDNTISKSSLFIVCASGNENLNQDIAYSYPSVSNYTISVGSISKDEKRSYFSNYGTTLDFVAPGSDINVARPRSGNCSNNCYKIGSGTSFATPYISAAAALILADHPEYQNKTIKNYLISISKDLGESNKDIYYGYGVPIFKDNDARFSDDNFIEEYSLSLSNKNYFYDGRYKEPSVILKDKNNNIIDKKNYKVKYINNLNSGIALVSVSGTGDYYGTISDKFVINKTQISGNIHLSKTKYDYTGKDIKPGIILTDSRGVVVDSKNYSVSYSNNKNIGAATVIINGKNNYKGSIYKKFEIVPKKVKIKSAKQINNKLSLKWKKVAGSPTYQIKYKKRGSKWKTKYTTNNYINLKIKKNKTYYVKVRAYKKKNTTKYYGTWSKTYKLKF